MPRPHPALVPDDRPAEHPAFAAWRRLEPTAFPPTRLETLKETWKTRAYRMAGCGPAGVDLVAIRRATETTLVERTIYRDVLPLAQVPRLRLHGLIDDDDRSTWMFLDDAGEDKLDLRRHADRVLAGAWLGRLHADLAQVSFADQLPERGLEDALATLRSARAGLKSIARNKDVDDDDRRFVGQLVRRLDAVEARWPEFADVLADLPTSLVHADYVDKNLRCRPRGVPPVVPFDWEMSGWGVPLRDLSMVDLGAYLESGRAFWGRRAAELGQLADIGRLFVLLAGIGWERAGLDVGWLPRHRRHLPVYHERLGSVLVRLGMVPSAVRRQSDAPPARPRDRGDGTVTTERLLRGLRFMERRSAAQVTDVVDRVPNVYRSTFPSEVVRCTFDDGVERKLLVKRYVPGLQDGDPYWEGGPYEARIYDDVLAAHDLRTPTYFGSWSEAGTGDTFLALEFVEGWRLARSEPSWLVEGARWLGRLHREATPTALAQPGIRRYDASFFEDRARQASASVRLTLPAEAWIEGLVRRFDAEMVPSLLAGDHVFIHGEPYPANMIVSEGRIRTVDWQSAAIGPWAVDLACLTEGGWPSDAVRESEAAYARERWPDGIPSSFEAELEAARVYWSLRWLGASIDATTATRRPGYIERLRASADRLGLLVGGV